MIHDTFITNADPGDEQTPSPGRHHPDCGGNNPNCGCHSAHEDTGNYTRTNTPTTEENPYDD